MTGSLISETKPGLIEPEPNCAFCPGNGKVEIVCDLGSMYLIRAKDMATMKDRMDRWLIIPAEHVTSIEDLPQHWGETVNELLFETGLTTDFNLSMNIGPGAGQTEPHLHLWVLDRRTDSLGKGMDWLITQVIRLQKICLERGGKIRRLVRLVTGREHA